MPIRLCDETDKYLHFSTRAKHKKEKVSNFTVTELILTFFSSPFYVQITAHKLLGKERKGKKNPLDFFGFGFWVSETGVCDLQD